MSLFDHLNAILTDKRTEYFDNLSEKEQKEINPYMINRFISMKSDYLPMVNLFQEFLDVVGPRETFLFYSHCLPRKAEFLKYVKGKKEDKYEEWLVEIIKKYYQIGSVESIDYLDIFYESEKGKIALRDICEFFGVEPKLIKKVKI